jgi:antitoxin ParD1/3/4
MEPVMGAFKSQPPNRLSRPLIAIRMANFAGFTYLLDRRCAMATMNVSLPDRMRDWIEDRIRDGGYANASDYVRDLVRHDRERHDALVDAIVAGEESGISSRSVSEIAADTKAKLRNDDG